MRKLDERFMMAALDEAAAAFEADEVPIGTVIMPRRPRHRRRAQSKEQLRDPTAHAEMLAITAATAALGNWRLTGCTLYVTLEPCPMCRGNSPRPARPRGFRLRRPQVRRLRLVFNIVVDPRTNHQVALSPGVCAAECSQILQAFFQKQRAAGKK